MERELVGPPYEVVVELGKIREFAAATKSEHPSYRGERPVCPPTFLTTAGLFWGYTLDQPGDTALAELDVDRDLLLHAEEEYEFYGLPPRAGTRLTAQTRIARVFEKVGARGGALTFITSETTFRDQAGTLVALGRTTAVKTDHAPTQE
jgi:hypothetical protein